MYTTIAFFKGSVKDEHKNLSTYVYNDGYAVEEKGLYFDKGEAITAQRKRLDNDQTLLKVELVGVGESTTLITR